MKTQNITENKESDTKKMLKSIKATLREAIRPGLSVAEQARLARQLTPLLSELIDGFGPEKAAQLMRGIDQQLAQEHPEEIAELPPATVESMLPILVEIDAQEAQLN